MHVVGHKRGRGDVRLARPVPKRLGGDASGEAGTALVEMAFVVVLLSVFLFGIMTFGYLMSFKQNMTQAAAEGARAGATAPSADVAADALAATNSSLASFGQSCGNGAMTCTITPLVNCPSAASGHCVTVALDYDYANNPILPVVPLIGSALPSHILANSSAETNS
jgi:Flp pilus assembly protein TadG